jgi:hypothetical protein
LQGKTSPPYIYIYIYDGTRPIEGYPIVKTQKP